MVHNRIQHQVFKEYTIFERYTMIMNCKAALLTQDNQFGLLGLEVNYVEGTSKHRQGNQ